MGSESLELGTVETDPITIPASLGDNDYRIKISVETDVNSGPAGQNGHRSHHAYAMKRATRVLGIIEDASDTIREAIGG